MPRLNTTATAANAKTARRSVPTTTLVRECSPCGATRGADDGSLAFTLRSGGGAGGRQRGGTGTRRACPIPCPPSRRVHSFVAGRIHQVHPSPASGSRYVPHLPYRPASTMAGGRPSKLTASRQSPKPGAMSPAPTPERAPGPAPDVTEIAAQDRGNRPRTAAARETCSSARRASRAAEGFGGSTRKPAIAPESRDVGHSVEGAFTSTFKGGLIFPNQVFCCHSIRHWKG